MPDQDDTARGFEPLRRYTRVKFPELTDTELANHSFAIDDPLSFENLREEEPPLDQDLTWIGEYRLKQDLKCVFGHIHRWGFVFRDDEGRHYLIGNECGAQLLGSTNWRDFDRKQKELTNRSMYLRQLFAIRAAFAENRDWIKQLKKQPALKGVVELSREIEAYPELLRAVRQTMTRDGGEVFVMQSVRSRREEERREERETVAIEAFERLGASEKSALREQGRVPQISRSPIYRQEKVRAGVLRGLALFSSRTPAMPDTLRELVKQVDGFLDMERLPTEKKDVQRVSVNVRELVKRLVKMRDDIDEAISFFDRENLELFARWANQDRPDRSNYRVEANRLIVEKRDGTGEYALCRPESLVSIGDERFEVLIEASTAFARQFETVSKRRQSAKEGRTPTSSATAQTRTEATRR